MGSPIAWISAGMQLRLRPDWPSDGPAHQADGRVVQEVAGCVLVAAAAELACFLERVVSTFVLANFMAVAGADCIAGSCISILLGAFYFSFYETMTFDPRRVLIETTK
jgi:hypothetical protein